MVRDKLEENNTKAALRILVSDDTMAECNDVNHQLLQQKHPAAQKVREPRQLMATSLQISTDSVQASVLSFPSGSAGGVDGLRPQHLKDMLHSPTMGDTFLSTLTHFINFVLAGGIPDSVAHVFFGATLVALRKKDGGLRPIAIGHVLRRLASKVTCTAIMPTIIDYMLPTQLGCGISLGAEAIVHATRNFLQAAVANEIVVKLDWTNAFNCVNRECILEIVASRLPHIFNYIQSAYRLPSTLRFGEFHIKSDEGVQQGDPIGPVLFCLVLQPALTQLCSSLKVGYLDDVTLGGDAAQVAEDVASIKRFSASVGLELNMCKCEVICHRPQEAENLLQQFPDMVVVVPECATLLGAPLHPAAVAPMLDVKLNFLTRIRNRLVTLQSHEALYLLKCSLAIPRLLYTLRTAACCNSDKLREFDATIRCTLAEVVNVNFSDDQWKQASLPVISGGLGIRSATLLAPSAFLASAAGCTTLVQKLLPPNMTTTEDSMVEESLQTWTTYAGEEAVPPVGQAAKKMKEWDTPCVKASLQQIMAEAINPHERARFLAVKRGDSSAWLSAPPVSALGLRLSNDAVRIAVGLRLGSTLVVPHTCVCGEWVDSRGAHGLSCRRSAGRHSRHSALNGIIHRALTVANVPSVREPLGMFRNDGKRPDGMSQVPWKGGKFLVWDATVPDTLAPSHVNQSAVNPGAAAHKSEMAKSIKYSAITRDHFFVPMAIETLGVFGVEAWRFITDLGARVAAATENKLATSQLRQRLSVAIQTGNSISVLGTLDRNGDFGPMSSLFNPHA